MFALQHIHKSYKDKPVLDDISLSVNAGEVIALIGENGAGKTTLLKVVLGELMPDSGTVSLHHEALGYVPQEAEPKGTIQESFNKQVESWKADYALSLVELEGLPKTRKVESLSGGQKTRLALAKVLATEPEPTILLLDEPTNNLDADGLRWLEQFIKDFGGGMILVSHDRNFINKVATSIVELHKGKLKQYGGNYDFYKQQKEAEYQTELAKYESNVEERQRLKKSIKTQSDKSQHAHKHIKRNDNDKYQRDFFRNRVTVKLGQNAKMLQGRLEQLEEIEKPETSKDYKITIGGSVPPTKLILRSDNIAKEYGDKTLAYPDFEIRGTERLHIQGANGSGKTTLLKIAAGSLAPDNGSIGLGQNVKFGYFSQDVNGLDYNLNNFENLEITGASATAIYREARSLGLDENELRKKPSELSRGQQAKLSFAKLLLSQNHLLILDEPTNHLDLPTREKIEAALRNYSGAILIASHDNYFIKSINVTQELLLEGAIE
jgi:macrolide transport system ATP-binding/permease protein